MICIVEEFVLYLLIEALIVSSRRILIIVDVIMVEGCGTTGLDIFLEILDKLEIDS